MNEIWRVISTPTAFLVLILALVLIAYRKQLSPLLSALSEVTFGKVFSAKFLRQAITTEETTAMLPERPQQVTDSTKGEIVANLDEKFCSYLLHAGNRRLPYEEHFRLIGQEIFEWKPEAVGEEQPAWKSTVTGGLRMMQATGFFRALHQFNGLIFVFERSGEEDLLIRVDSDVLGLIRNRVGREPEQKQDP